MQLLDDFSIMQVTAGAVPSALVVSAMMVEAYAATLFISLMIRDKDLNPISTALSLGLLCHSAAGIYDLLSESK